MTAAIWQRQLTQLTVRVCDYYHANISEWLRNNSVDFHVPFFVDVEGEGAAMNHESARVAPCFQTLEKTGSKGKALPEKLLRKLALGWVIAHTSAESYFCSTVSPLQQWTVFYKTPAFSERTCFILYILGTKIDADVVSSAAVQDAAPGKLKTGVGRCSEPFSPSWHFPTALSSSVNGHQGQKHPWMTRQGHRSRDEPLVYRLMFREPVAGHRHVWLQAASGLRGKPHFSRPFSHTVHFTPLREGKPHSCTRSWPCARVAGSGAPLGQDGRAGPKEVLPAAKAAGQGEAEGQETCMLEKQMCKFNIQWKF